MSAVSYFAGTKIINTKRIDEKKKVFLSLSAVGSIISL